MPSDFCNRRRLDVEVYHLKRIDVAALINAYWLLSVGSKDSKPVNRQQLLKCVSGNEYVRKQLCVSASV